MLSLLQGSVWPDLDPGRLKILDPDPGFSKFRIRIQAFLKFRIRQKHLDPAGSGSETLVYCVGPDYQFNCKMSHLSRGYLIPS